MHSGANEPITRKIVFFRNMFNKYKTYRERREKEKKIVFHQPN
ncbi:Protein CBG26616 [Caenorhabditis briggsae]|uniref:Protein CBG26616 n=1 Tax=Caenorhabditis briggsae TaxID=6238 RepID=B6IL96_CAEBR|nr:Protein CBG26616 [Caenorhabditis briggsae]CAS00676.1 Protein CBG26616 [Caenorhabditis briggsae]